ncbi:AAA family ATPase [Neptuniibacter sp. QD48_11]|uniref:AAA family ATPase n=1 Tax=unclassified Neptuniibacter TaxID=2630693 RepID=UPI0039F50184
MIDLNRVKRSYITRNVNFDDVTDVAELLPETGDLLLARVDRIRQHTRIENPYGRREHLFVDDLIIVAAGDRYATDQFYAKSPEQLGKTQLVAAGGIAGDVISKSAQVKAATEITVLGVLVNSQGQKINLENYSTLKDAYLHPSANEMPVLLVVGSDMNSGKTSMASSLINGFTKAGYKAAAAKLTGTGSGPDYWKMVDAGAFQVKDFLDAGYPTTVNLSETKLVQLLQRLKMDAVQADADLLVVELADGVLQPQNKALIANGRLLKEVSASMVAADSSTAAAFCAEKMIEAGFPIYGLGGLFTRAELCADEVQDSLGLPIYSLDALRKVSTAKALMASLERDHSYVTSYAI